MRVVGEVADMILDGTLCQKCGGLVNASGEMPVGFPRDCADCRRENNRGRWVGMKPNPLGRKKVHILRALRDGPKPWADFGPHREGLKLMGYVEHGHGTAQITDAGLVALDRYERENGSTANRGH